MPVKSYPWDKNAVFVDFIGSIFKLKCRCCRYCIITQYFPQYVVYTYNILDIRKDYLDLMILTIK